VHKIGGKAYKKDMDSGEEYEDRADTRAHMEHGY